MTSPLITIIIPIYNILDCLEKCVRSVCAQTYTNLEILLIDDGSTDGTADLCDQLALTDSRIRVYHKKNGGSSSARNLGIQLAQGKYLGFVDSDDFIEPEMYENMVQELEAGTCEIVQTSRDEIDENGCRRPDVCIPPETITFQKTEDFMRELLMHRGDCSFCTKLIPARFFAARRFPEGELNEDFRLLVDMLRDVDGVCILPQQTYHVFYRIGSNTRKKDKNDFSRVFEDIVRNADYVQGIVDTHFPVLQKEAIRFNLFQRLDYLLHIPVSRMNDADPLYAEVKKYCRKHVSDTISNPYLTPKQKIYLLLLTAAPKTVRRMHGKIMELRR